jgi:hypothetical protein
VRQPPLQQSTYCQSLLQRPFTSPKLHHKPPARTTLVPMHMLDSRHAPTVCAQPPKQAPACRAASSSLHESQGCSGILVNTPTPPLQKYTAYTHHPAPVANAYTTAARVWPRVWIQSIEGSVWGAWMPWVHAVVLWHGHHLDWSPSCCQGTAGQHPSKTHKGWATLGYAGHAMMLCGTHKPALARTTCR